MRYAVQVAFLVGSFLQVSGLESACVRGAFTPTFTTLPIESLPDPFTFQDGTPVQSHSDWECRRQEVKSMLQEYELGFKPAKPTKVDGAIINGTLQIQVTENNKTINFSAPLKYPTEGSGPFPLMIALGSYNLSPL